MLNEVLSKKEIKMSSVGIGTWAIGADMWGHIDDQSSIHAIRTGIEHGINLIDTAPIYGSGHSEEMVGMAIKGQRDKVIISTKCGMVKDINGAVTRNLSPTSIRKEVENSLSRMGIECIDIYYLHYPDDTVPIEETLDEMNKLKIAGKIREIGVSNFSKNQLIESMKIADIEWIQPQLSVLSRENHELIEFAKEHGIGVITYGSLAASMLTGKIKEMPVFAKNDARVAFYPFFREPMFSKCLRMVAVLENIAEKHGSPVSSVAINWVVQQEGVSAALVGIKTPAQAIENSFALTWSLSADELQLIDNSYLNIFRSEE